MSFSKDELLEIGIRKKNGEYTKEDTWNKLNEDNGKFFSDGEQYRQWVKTQLRSGKRSESYGDTFDNGGVNNPSNEKSGQNGRDESDSGKGNFKETSEINNENGIHTSSKLVKMSLEQKKDPRFLLEAHGYNPDTWELITAKDSKWTVGLDQIPQYASKISAKPSEIDYNLSKLIETIKNGSIKPFEIDIQPIIPDGNHLLEVSLFDAHFGIGDYEYYKPTQSDIFEKINSRKWKEVLFTIGQDMIHNNDFKGNTANGTPIEKIDMNKAWEDCCKFYEPLITLAVSQQSANVKIMYSKGNHDETISWAFVKYLKARFPTVEFDDSFEERKIHTFGKIFIGITHGDKGNNKDLANIFIKEFPLEWANATIQEIHKGHFHKEDGIDFFGTMVRTLATRNKTDLWHKDKGFIGANKRFMLFEYSETSLKGISYV